MTTDPDQTGHIIMMEAVAITVVLTALIVKVNTVVTIIIGIIIDMTTDEAITITEEITVITTTTDHTELTGTVFVQSEA